MARFMRHGRGQFAQVNTAGFGLPLVPVVNRTTCDSSLPPAPATTQIAAAEVGTNNRAAVSLGKIARSVITPDNFDSAAAASTCGWESDDENTTAVAPARSSATKINQQGNQIRTPNANALARLCLQCSRCLIDGCTKLRICPFAVVLTERGQIAVLVGK